MATSDMRTNGDLNRCKYCGKPLSIVDGTDPDDADDGFTETYECPNGHQGRYEFEYQNSRETFTGACLK